MGENRDADGGCEIAVGGAGAVDFGDQAVRVNAISAGPVRTLAGSGVADARLMFNYQRRHAPLGRTVSIEEIGLLMGGIHGTPEETHLAPGGELAVEA